MQPEDLLRHLRQRPFRPFRVHLADGRTFDIRFPEINMVGKAFFDIGIPVPEDPDPVFDTTVTVPLAEITGVEVLTVPAPPVAP